VQTGHHNEMGLQIQRGRKLDFLGLEVEFRDDGKASIGTVQYLTNMIKL